MLKMVSLLVAAGSGVAMAVQGALNTFLGKIIGLLEATLIVHLVGLALLAVLFLFGLGKGDLTRWAEAPWYTYLGGVLGVAIVYGVVVAISRVGVAVATTAIIVGQLGTALLLDHFGLFGLEVSPFSWEKGVGFVLLTVGAWFILG